MAATFYARRKRVKERKRRREKRGEERGERGERERAGEVEEEEEDEDGVWSETETTVYEPKEPPRSRMSVTTEEEEVTAMSTTTEPAEIETIEMEDGWMERAEASWETKLARSKEARSPASVTETTTDWGGATTLVYVYIMFLGVLDSVTWFPSELKVMLNAMVFSPVGWILPSEL